MGEWVEGKRTVGWDVEPVEGTQGKGDHLRCKQIKGLILNTGKKSLHYIKLISF